LGHLFAGEVLRTEEQREYLVRLLEKRSRSRMLGTKLLFRWDPLNSSNFHKYIDGREHMVLLVRLANGLVFGGWAAGGVAPQSATKGDGLIFSVSNQQAFELVQAGQRATVYDDFYLMFGNSEIRLKSMEAKVFCNFGISKGYYNSRGQSVEVLLGSGEHREIPLSTYEIFQLKTR
jgi:hypothetical protein